ncbi:MAG: DUF3604 domain-containing protein [Myxococcota bacterium]
MRQSSGCRTHGALWLPSGFVRRKVDPSAVVWGALARLLVAGLGGCGDDAASADASSDADAGDATGDAPPRVVMLPDEREACSGRNELRNAYFGDLHAHTALSFDAVTFDVRTRPRDAYNYAKGQPIGLPPYDAAGNPTRMAQLRRPLDFAAVTDHAEFLTESSLCFDSNAPGFDTLTCETYREGNSVIGDFGELTTVFLLRPPPLTGLCANDPELCRRTGGMAWEEIQNAAEESYDRSAECSFTTFVAYEWTAAPIGSNIHRNVYFRNRTVPVSPVGYVDAPSPEQLWDALDLNCRETGTSCDALVIPHNSNLGSGLMFRLQNDAEEPYDAALAQRRQLYEPLVELYQHKGSSECVLGAPSPLASEDELCDFEILQASICTGAPTDAEDCAEVCEDGAGVGFLGGCFSPSDLVRGALRRGLGEQLRIGENPFEMGFIGSSDSHNALLGGVDEDNWPGHQGDSDDDPDEALAVGGVPLVRGFTTSPGGLAVLWAEENSRDSLFDAMQRRETYATSGTRMSVRFFGGFDLPEDLCDRSTLVADGYASGVPMGGTLERNESAALRFVVSAARDPMANPLQRIEIIKGWAEDGMSREEVIAVAGDPDNGASVDVATCTPVGDGFDTLCGSYTDPTFDPDAPAFYYARVVENPSCRWSQYICNGLSLDCATLSEDHPHYACCDPERARTIQERAWTSPIYYHPN